MTARRTNVISLLAVTAAALLAGCGDAEPPAETPPGPGTAASSAAGGAEPGGSTATAVAPSGNLAPGDDLNRPQLVPIREPDPPRQPPKGPAKVGQNAYRTTSSGLKIAVLKPGKGPQPKRGDHVHVHYTGWLQKGGKRFDSSLPTGVPIVFPLGGGQVIDGWDEGIAGMKVGERRQLVVPAKLGYGQGGYPPDIPPGAALVFDVELVRFDDSGPNPLMPAGR